METKSHVEMRISRAVLCGMRVMALILVVIILIKISTLPEDATSLAPLSTLVFSSSFSEAQHSEE